LNFNAHRPPPHPRSATAELRHKATCQRER
jgi:hypothetical protein